MTIETRAQTCMMYLVRHGATANNQMTPPRLQGRKVDLDLSPDGVAQAEATAAFLAEHPIASVYASPMRRARQTAEAIAAPHGLEVRLLDGLVECDVGDWEGKSWGEIERDEPEAYRLFQEDSYRHGYRGGENIAQVERRSQPALIQAAAENVGRRIVVVAHNVVNRTFLGGLLEIPPSRRRLVPQDNCGISLIRYRDGAFKAETINMAFHLPRG